jgi:hypothetical protein
MFAPETCAKLFVRNTPAGTALIHVAAVAVLFGLLRTLLVLRSILLLRGSGLVIAIVLVLLFGPIALPIAVILLRPIVLSRLIVLPRTIVLLRGLGAISILLLSVRFLFGLVRGPFLILPTFIRLFALLGLFLRPVFIRFLPRIAGGADKEHHHRCTKDEFHFDSSVFLLELSGVRRNLRQQTNAGLAGIVTSSTAGGKPR